MHTSGPVLHKAETPGAKMLVGLSSVELHFGQSQTLVREAQWFVTDVG